ncbi:FAD-binding oxidoreductase [Rhodococcus sp. NPDC003383]
MNAPFTPQHPDEAPTMAWDAWGTEDRRIELSARVLDLLEQALGVDTGRDRVLPEADVRLSPGRLRPEHRDELARIVGRDHFADDDRTRLRHAGGKSTLDLLRRRSRAEQDAPDAVLFPGSHEEVVAVLSYCSTEAIAVVPFGGGTSVVGGVDPVRGRFEAVVTVDLRRLTALTSLDPVSGLATLQAGATGPQTEQLLAAHGFSLGHFPQSYRHATLGGFAVTRSAGQASAGYGRFEDMVDHLVVATPRGTLRAGRAPASAAGPDLRRLFLGSEGTLGIVTEVGVRIHPVPATTAFRAWSFPDFATGAAALRTLAGTGALPTVLRLSDEAETGMNLALHENIGGDAPGGCLAVTTVEGSEAHVRARAAEVAALLAASGGTDLGDGPARAWQHGRFDAPHLRDALLRVGALAETLETATTWSNLLSLRASVTEALTADLTAQGTPPLVMCHISHTYPTGASLYFTVVCAQSDDPIAQWSRAKRAAGDAIVAAGGTITHHHAVGRDHLPWLEAEVGDLGLDVLAAVKNAIDPRGILNPGKLIG